MRSRGFTLAELIVSLCLMGIVAAAVGSVFVGGLRFYTRQMDRAQINANLRVSMAMLTREIRLLDARDSTGGDLIEMGATFITYRAVRSTYFLCAPPDPARQEVIVWGSAPVIALRDIEPGRDSALLFATGGQAANAGDKWLPAAVTWVATGAACPGGAPSLTIGLSGVDQAELGGVGRGAPLRGYQATMILLYRDGEGQSWVGVREWSAGSGWSVTQPIAGPVSENGLRFDYFGPGARVATVPSDVARIGVTIVGVGNGWLRPARGTASPIRDSVVFQVALKNNQWAR